MRSNRLYRRNRMLICNKATLSIVWLLFWVGGTFADEAGDEIAEITVTESRVANTRPAGTYASPATVLRFDPTTELQSRGLPEGQADVTVRGGLFENTGFKTGAVTIMDPQTGHYVAELPIDPGFLSAPQAFTTCRLQAADKPCWPQPWTRASHISIQPRSMASALRNWNLDECFPRTPVKLRWLRK